MKLPSLRRARPTELPGIAGVVRLDRRTKNLTKRLKPGEIAVIDHVDLDRVSAEALVDCQVAAVVNVADSISGRYPNLGPEILVEAGIPLVDGIGREVFSILHEGERVRLHDGTCTAARKWSRRGSSRTARPSPQLMDDARAGLSTQLEAFTANTLEYLRRERDLLLDGVGVPAVHTAMDGKHVLIVVRGYDYREDLVALRPYIREYRPVLIGVDGGADALVENGYVPDLIVGDMDSVKDETLKCGAEVVVHAYRDGRAPGSERLERLGVRLDRVPRDRDQRGRRDAAGRLQGCLADRRGRYPQLAGRVPRQGTLRDGQHLHHPACASVRSWWTPRASAGCTAAGSRPSRWSR